MSRPVAYDRVQEAYQKIAEQDRPEVFIHLRPQAEVQAEFDAARGPLAGLLLAVKDNVDVAGLPTTAACPAYAYTPNADAPAVAALTAAGATVIGKTNLDQFATGLVGVRSPYGAVRDSRRLDRISGGSSSGSAVAVALGFADIAIGTDTAGSGRVPAALQGIVGIKPTYGVVSAKGVVPACASYDCVTVFAPDLRLANLAMEAMAKAAGRPWAARPRLAAPQDAIIAVPEQLVAMDPAWAEAFEAVALRLPQDRVRRIDLAPFLDAAKLLYEGALVVERHHAVGAFVDEHPDEVDQTVGSIVRSAGSASATSLLADRDRVAELRERAFELLGDADVLLVPTTTTHPTIADVLADPIAINSRMGTYTNFCNLFDLCAVSVPSGEVGEDQFGVTVLARAFEDAVALDVAARVLGEEPPVVPWVPLGEKLVVVGAHLRGMPLEHQLVDLGARWLGPVRTAPAYRLRALDTVPPKPGLVRALPGEAGVSVEGEAWLLSEAALGRFLADLPAPMLLGSVELEDGSRAVGFSCEAQAAAQAKDITEFGGWRSYTLRGA
ncbi:allophanate hydrolase [Segniliparus rotundus DSM 44985]|uniref:Allophanate hydrolase n=1 Tax=Segniliparus rotundus (strain ATCC BAA-972 / CDC 1076 / CIP 108378 / DSM 44985 / JCM 13578) TaxID=640132 RepID=D6ZAM0_SEGRD|nr:allophanate hydrolase [Segniliparus rotundus]ADG98756.1 allophanate hydrolase [Segniliparus rotundus DSM 44985]